MDTLSPLETRINSQLGNLARDATMTRSYLSKINELTNEVMTLDKKIDTKATPDDIDSRFQQLQGYVTMKAFQGLQRIVS